MKTISCLTMVVAALLSPARDTCAQHFANRYVPNTAGVSLTQGRLSGKPDDATLYLRGEGVASPNSGLPSAFQFLAQLGTHGEALWSKAFALDADIFARTNGQVMVRSFQPTNGADGWVHLAAYDSSNGFTPVYAKKIPARQSAVSNPMDPEQQPMVLRTLSNAVQLVKFDLQGAFLWAREYQFTNNIQGGFVRTRSDGSLVIYWLALVPANPLPVYESGRLLLDAQGNVLKRNAIRISLSIFSVGYGFLFFEETPDGGAVGFDTRFGLTNSSTLAVRIAPDGSLPWSRAYNGVPGTDRDIVDTNGLLLTGLYSANPPASNSVTSVLINLNDGSIRNQQRWMIEDANNFDHFGFGDDYHYFIGEKFDGVTRTAFVARADAALNNFQLWVSPRSTDDIHVVERYEMHNNLRPHLLSFFDNNSHDLYAATLTGPLVSPSCGVLANPVPLAAVPPGISSSNYAVANVQPPVTVMTIPNPAVNEAAVSVPAFSLQSVPDCMAGATVGSQPPILRLRKLPNGTVGLEFEARAQATYRILNSTNLQLWTSSETISNQTGTVSRQYSATNKQTFFRVEVTP